MEPISRIDSSHNQLFFRGINALDLARSSDFESSLYLLIHGNLPTLEQHKELFQRMIELRKYYSENIESLEALARNLNELKNRHLLNLHDTLLAFVSLTPLIVAHQFVESQGREADCSVKDSGHAANFLWLARGFRPKQREINDFQTCLILHLDDPDNPSLTALQKALDEGCNASEAIVAALSEHVDPLHHGAGTEAMLMFEAIAKPSNVRRYLQQRLDNHQKIFGLGHRIYQGIDPRAVELREILKRRTKNTCDEWLVGVADAVAMEGSALLEECKSVKAYPNVDLYNAATYYTFGFPPELNTMLFAVSRVAGWMAHIIQWYSNREAEDYKDKRL